MSYCVLVMFLVKYERIKFLVIALKNSVEIYAWAPKPYHKFMAFKVRRRKHAHAHMYFIATVSSRLLFFFPPDCHLLLPPHFFSPPSPVCFSSLPPFQSFTELQHRPQLVDLTVEEGQRLKVIYGSSVGFHVIDVDSGNPYDIYIPSHVSAGPRLHTSECVSFVNLR